MNGFGMGGGIGIPLGPLQMGRQIMERVSPQTQTDRYLDDYRTGKIIEPLKVKIPKLEPYEPPVDLIAESRKVIVGGVDTGEKLIGSDDDNDDVFPFLKR